MIPDSWVSIVEEEENKLTSQVPNPSIDTEMEIDDALVRTAVKRKKARNLDSDSVEEDSASDTKKNLRHSTRSRRKRTPPSAADKINTGSKDQELLLTGSNQDSAMSGTDTEDRKGKVGRPRRKVRAIDPIIAEQDILKKTGIAPEHIEEEVLKAMTAAEVCVQALEYISNIETIRTKCGRLQGGLSGELRKMSHGLGELVRELQFKAEAVGDPVSLKNKIDELVQEARKSKKDREKEEDRRKQEKSEFLEIIAELKKENLEIRKENREIKAEMRREMREIRASIDRTSMDRDSCRRSEEKDDKENKGKKKRVSFERETGPPPSLSPKPQRRSPLSGVDSSPTKSVLAFQRLEENLQEAYKITGGDEWPIKGESWSPPPPANKKRKLDPGHEPLVRFPLQSGHDDTALFSGQGTFSMESIPSTSRGIPSMTFSRTGDTSRVAIPMPKPRIVVKENIQLKPPRESEKTYAGILKKVSTYVQKSDTPAAPYSQTSSSPDQAMKPEHQWFTIGRRGKSIQQQQSTPTTPKRLSFKNLLRKERKRLPATAAVCIRGSKKDFDYADALKRARENISLKDLDILNPKIRKGITGSTIIEIAGPDNIKKADLLAIEMGKMLSGEAVVSRPNIKAEIKLIGLDESITVDDVRAAISSAGSCKANDVIVGQIGRNRFGEGIVWAKCPKAVALDLAEKKKLQIGWSRPKVELLPVRPVQCHKCWRLGHVRSKCRSSKDYTGRCFKCGAKDHKIETCKNKVRCIICADKHLPDNHRMGSTACRSTNLAPSPRTSTETEVDNSPPKDTSSTPPSEAAKTESPSLISSPEKEQQEDSLTVTPTDKPYKSSERRTDESMEIVELEQTR